MIASLKLVGGFVALLAVSGGAVARSCESAGKAAGQAAAHHAGEAARVAAKDAEHVAVPVAKAAEEVGPSVVRTGEQGTSFAVHSGDHVGESTVQTLGGIGGAAAHGAENAHPLPQSFEQFKRMFDRQSSDIYAQLAANQFNAAVPGTHSVVVASRQITLPPAVSERAAARVQGRPRVVAVLPTKENSFFNVFGHERTAGERAQIEAVVTRFQQRGRVLGADSERLEGVEDVLRYVAAGDPAAPAIVVTHSKRGRDGIRVLVFPNGEEISEVELHQRILAKGHVGIILTCYGRDLRGVGQLSVDRALAMVRAAEELIARKGAAGVSREELIDAMLRAGEISNATAVGITAVAVVGGGTGVIVWYQWRDRPSDAQRKPLEGPVRTDASRR